MARLWERSRERMDCLLHGHRDLTRAAAYSETSAGRDKELHYCGACGGAAWVSTPPKARRTRTWADMGLKSP
jgi:hypothetical protein